METDLGWIRKEYARHMLEKLLPKYMRKPALIILLVNMLTYFGTRVFTQNLVHHNLSNPVDDMLPLVTAMISVYILAYVQWVAGYVVIGRESRELCYWMYSGEMIAKLICLLCFVFYPTTIDRPEIVGNGIFEQLTRLIYEMDAPDNLFPSIHCLESYVSFRGALYTKKVPVWYKYVMLISTVLVFASTVLVKQHVLVDMLGAVLAVEFGLFVSKKWNLGRIFKKINHE